MRAVASFGVLLVGAGLAGCVPPSPAGTGAPTTLSTTWLIGVETVQGDVTPLLPATNQMIATLAAMPRTQILSLGATRNAWEFDSVHAPRLRLAPVLRGDGACMTFLYTIFVDGQETGRFGLTIPRPAAGVESDPACVIRAASQLYLALAAQGL